MNRFFMRYQKAIIWTVVVGFLLGGIGLFTFQRFSPPPRGSAEEVVLVVEGKKFSRQDVQDAYDNLIQYYTQLYQVFGQDFTQNLQGTDGAFNRHIYRASAAEGLIRQTLIRKEARALHVSVPKAELDQAVEERYQKALERFGGDEKTLESYLSAQGLTLADYRRQLRASQEYQLLEEGVHKQVVGPIEPTDEELLTYYQEHQDRYQSQPERIRIAYIKVSNSELADQLLAQAQAPDADFAALAKEHSEDENYETDWFSKGGSGLPREVEDAAFKLSKGQVTLVDVLGDYYIVKLLGRKPAVVPPFEEIRDRVEEDYIRDEDNRHWTEWYETLRKGAKIEVPDPLLHAFLVYPSDKKAALDILLAAEAQGTISDLYLDYYIGRMYEQLYIDVGTQMAELKGKDELTEEEQAKLEELSAQEEEYKQKAIEYYLRFADTGEGDEAFFNRVVALDPGFVAAYIGQGDAAMAMQLYGRAIQCFKEALALQTGSRTIELRLAEAYLRDEQYDQARPLLEKLLQAQPDNDTVQMLMGDLLLAQGDAEGAIERYQAAFRDNPTSEVQLKLAHAYLVAGLPGRGLRRPR